MDLFNKFKNSSIVVGRRGKEIIFLDKDYRFVFKKSEIKKIEIYSEIMHITQLGYSYRLTIEGKDKNLTLYDHSKALLLYLESPNTEIIIVAKNSILSFLFFIVSPLLLYFVSKKKEPWFFYLVFSSLKNRFGCVGFCSLIIRCNSVTLFTS